MNKKQYQKLVDKIIEAVPGILELKRGCVVEFEEEIEYPQYVFNKRMEFLTEVGGGQIADTGDCDDYNVFYLTPDGYIYQDDTDVRSNKIIGRDITLEDCLIAFRSEGISIRVNTMGEFFEHQPKTGKWEVNNSTVFWILNKPLQDQSDETKEFLANLLK